MARRKSRAGAGDAPARQEKPKAPPAEAWHFPSFRADWPHLAGVAATALAVYAVTMPRVLTLEDSGIFIMSVNVAGISHPPGYPIHSLLGKLFSLLPVGSVALRVHLLSAVFGALSAAVLWALAHALTGKKAAAWGAALSFAFSRELWAQSTIAEVYSLNVFLCLLLLFLCLRYRAQPEPRLLAGVSAVVGLSLAHHWPLAALAFPGAALLLWPARKQVLSGLPRALPFVAAGLLPYAWMVWRSNQSPAISFYGPIDSLERAWFFVSRKGFAEVDTNLGATVDDQLKFAGYFLQQAWWQLTPLGAALALGGAALQRRRLPASVSAALWAVFLGASLLLAALLQRRFGYLEQAVFKVYPLMPYAVLALWAALGLAEVQAQVDARRAGAGPKVTAALSGLLVAATLAAGYQGNDRSGDSWAHDYATMMLEAVEPNAIVIAGEDTDTGPLGEVHHVEGVRPDVALYNAEGLVFANRLFRPPVTPTEKAKALQSLIEGTERPVYLVSDNTQSPWGTVDYGLVRKVTRTAGVSFGASPPILSYCGRIAAQTGLTDAWNIDHRHRLLRRCGLVLAGLVLKTSPPREDLRPVLDAVSATFAGKLGVAEAVAPTAPPQEVLALAAAAEALADPTVPTQGLAMVHYLRGFALYRTDLAAGVAAFEKSLELFPEPTNGAALALLQLHASTRNRDAYWKVHDRVFGKKTPPPQVREMDKALGR